MTFSRIIFCSPSAFYLDNHRISQNHDAFPYNTVLVIGASSGIGLAWISILRYSNYCTTKAATHHLMLTLREQLRVAENSKILKVIKILPPAVQTELHDEKYQPNIKNEASMGMPLKSFTEEAWQGLVQGKEDVSWPSAKS
jgi:short-subunit dehydrogenase involved in D-alanine esterification of teichoic acids